MKIPFLPRCARDWVISIALSIFIVVVSVKFFALSQDLLNRDKVINLPDPEAVMTDSVHKVGYQDSWLIKIEDDLVQVEVVDTKTAISFRSPRESLSRFRNIVAITFLCAKGFNDDCDLSEPYELYANKVKVQLLALKKKFE